MLKGMPNPRGADEDGIVVEMIKHASKSFKDMLLSVYVPILFYLECVGFYLNLIVFFY